MMDLIYSRPSAWPGTGCAVVEQCRIDAWMHLGRTLQEQMSSDCRSRNPDATEGFTHGNPHPCELDPGILTGMTPSLYCCDYLRNY